MEHQIEIYRSSKGIEVAILLENDTVWATQRQMAEIFDTTPQNITLHLKKVYKEEEIEESATCKEYLQVQKEGKRNVQRTQLFYNLDAILSVGYKINSTRGTQFRQWATQRLKEYLVKGYAINQKRLDELGKIVQLVELSEKTENLQLNEAKGLLEILNSYTRSFVLLNQYDSRHLQPGKRKEHITYEIKYDEAKAAIAELKKQLMSKKEASPHFVMKKMTVSKVHYKVLYKLMRAGIYIRA
ncbi:MAG: virulence RhuM family protein [Chitinophagaceae bacterium]